MKKLILLLSCSSLLCFAKCNKDKIPKAELPSATQEGKNTVGFTIDGEIWIPYAKCGFGRNPCGEISGRYSNPFAPLNGIDFGFTRQIGTKSSHLAISSALIGTITSTGDKIDSIGVSFDTDGADGLDGRFAYPAHGSRFLISKIDTINQIISGEFEFILKEENGSGKLSL